MFIQIDEYLTRFCNLRLCSKVNISIFYVKECISKWVNMIFYLGKRLKEAIFLFKGVEIYYEIVEEWVSSTYCSIIWKLLKVYRWKVWKLRVEERVSHFKKRLQHNWVFLSIIPLTFEKPFPLWEFSLSYTQESKQWIESLLYMYKLVLV